MITKKTEWLPWIMQLFLIFHNFFEKPQKLQKSQFLLGTLLPPVTLDLINFSKNCDFSNFLQFLEKLQKSQFLLGTLVPPLTLVITNFSKNCNFSNFSQFLEKLQFLLDTLLPPVDLINFSKNCDFSHFFAIFGEIVEIAEVAVFAGHPSTSCNT